MKKFINRLYIGITTDDRGMELVQVAILIARAVVIGLIFNKQITGFVNGVFKDLMHAKF